ncbi:tetratricopeptide repeat protein [Streptomyces sp. NPDC048710]|uniref:tetratricopeptide repeat protein n=1 Tax=Streptomyces sp. NPDC048710 TaxID=3365586 RepID=UPI00371FD1AD
MNDEQGMPNSALAKLHKRLNIALANSGLGKKQLAHRAGLGRTTVSQAFQPDGPVPTARTVALLAKKLNLPREEQLELLELQRAADAVGVESAAEVELAPGKPISQWEPQDLEVHPAGPVVHGPGPGSPQPRLLPGYVRRRHDHVLAEAVQDGKRDHSRMLVLVGTSSTGKTRACWEAVQPLADEGWRLWHPFDPTRAEAAFRDLERVRPRTIVWLNEAQHYLGDAQMGERIAAALHALLTDPPRGPVLILGTLWPEYARQYTALPVPGQPDPHSRVRELLAGRTLSVPSSFDAQALRDARILAEDGDRLLADALSRAGTHGQVTQDLAGAPELLRRYEYASPAARALLEAAMDARRLGVGLHLPQTFLTDAVSDYLSETDYEDLTDDWAEAVCAELAHPSHGKQVPLRRTDTRPVRRPPGTPPCLTPSIPTSPGFRLADYLEQHGRITRRRVCPPASFWHAAHEHLTHPDDLNNLGQAADARYRLQWAHCLTHRAADAGSTDALMYLARTRERAGDPEGAQALYQQAAQAGDIDALVTLADIRERAGNREGAEALYQQAAEAGSTNAMSYLAAMREEAGDREGAEILYQRAADAGDVHSLALRAEKLEQAGEPEGAQALYQQAADAGNTDALIYLARTRERAGDPEGAQALYQQAADAGNTDALIYLAGMRERAGDPEGAQALYQQAADAGNTSALGIMVLRWKETGDWEAAEASHRQAADAGNTSALMGLAFIREQVGDRQGAEAMARQAINAGRTDALESLAFMRERTGDPEGAEALYQQAAEAGSTNAMSYLAAMREEAGDRESAENLYQRAADAGDVHSLVLRAEKLEQAGEREGAQALYRQAADIGINRLNLVDRFTYEPWPYGLEPNGDPTSPWRCSVCGESR